MSWPSAVGVSPGDNVRRIFPKCRKTAPIFRVLAIGLACSGGEVDKSILENCREVQAAMDLLSEHGVCDMTALASLAERANLTLGEAREIYDRCQEILENDN